MSIKLMASIYELVMDTETRDILMALADHADDDGYRVYPSVAKIAWKLGDASMNQQGEYSYTRTIQRKLSELKAMGALVELKPAGFHRPTEYGIDLSVFPKKPAFIPKGDKFEAKGDKKRVKGDTTLSPEPSLNQNEPKQEAQAPTVAEMWNAIPSASNAEIADNGLIPLTQEERHLFSALNVERAAKHHTPLTRFKTTKQREKFRGCVAIFNGSTCTQIDELIANGKSDIESVVNALDWRRRNNALSPEEHPPEKDTPAVDMSMVILR